MSSVMILGATSGAGKTTVAAMLCRMLSSEGVDVAPFKAQNLSLNSYVTKDGGEIGVSQAFQAWACGLEPETDMNPVLLKPKGPGQCQVVLAGRPFMDAGRGVDVDREAVMSAVKGAYRRLSSKHSMIVLEGSGSPAEINLRSRDVANMATAEAVGAPCVLVGDIERGGVFAGLYGTCSLLEERHRPLIKGFLINRFRGDPSILGAGISRLEELMGVPCLGVLPYGDVRLPAEDGLDLRSGRGPGGGGDVRQAWLGDLDRLCRMSRPHLDLDGIKRIAERGPR